VQNYTSDTNNKHNYKVLEWYGLPLFHAKFGGAWTLHAAGGKFLVLFFFSPTLLNDEVCEHHFMKILEYRSGFGTVGTV